MLRMDDKSDATSLLEDIYNMTFDYGILTCDLDGTVITWNVGAERITGFSTDDMVGSRLDVLFTPEDRQRGEPQQEMIIAKTKGRAEDYRWHLRKDGSRFWADGVLTPAHDRQNRHCGFLKIFRDITEAKLAQSKIHRIASRDLLTGLFNRHAFQIRAAELIALAIRSTQPLALQVIDLNRFKQVNDTLGHRAGDLLLQQAAGRIVSTARSTDVVGRLGGDEFVVLQPDVLSMDDSAQLAEKLTAQLAQPYEIEGKEARISGSIGIAVCPADAQDFDQLLKKADLAMYQAKQNGGGSYHYFTRELDQAAHRKTRDRAEIRRAVDRNQFHLKYQPRVDSVTRAPLAVEALLRCSNTNLSGYPVESVVDLAVDGGLMKGLSLWVLEAACTQLKEWQQNGFPDLRICINLTSEDLVDTATPERLDAIFARTGVQPDHVEIEITERYALDVGTNGVAILNALRARGISIEIDDFGTGYSALSYLRKFPVTGVKLDKSFLAGVPEEPQGCAVIKAVVNLAMALDLDVIAEGVETEEQARFLRSIGCPSLQGFLFTPPLPAAAMTAWLQARAQPPQARA